LRLLVYGADIEQHARSAHSMRNLTLIRGTYGRHSIHIARHDRIEGQQPLCHACSFIILQH
jgi:hypothetical protein